MNSHNTLLQVENLSLSYRAGRATLRGLKDVSFTLARGNVLGVVGESGSGKSTLSFAITRLLPGNSKIDNGRVMFKDADLAHASDSELARLRGDRIAMIFQDPLSSLHPCLPIGRQMTDAMRAHRSTSDRACRDRAIEMLTLVGIPDAVARLKCFPHEFSGGMRQRIMIAMAVMLQPDLLIADEPTSALDVALQGQIIGLLGDLRDRFGTAVILVSHDLGVIGDIADDVLVMYAGEAMELSGVDEIFNDPLHPYTKALLTVMPGRNARGKPLPVIPGRVPSAHESVVGCAFAGRCAMTRTVCLGTRPSFSDVAGRRVRCHIYDTSSGWHAEAASSAERGKSALTGVRA